jgi:hypothetical protein
MTAPPRTDSRADRAVVAGLFQAALPLLSIPPSVGQRSRMQTVLKHSQQARTDDARLLENLVSDFTDAYLSELYSDLLRQTLLTEYTLDGYRREHGHLPERLEQLVPAWLPTVPEDPRNAGRALVYLRTESDYRLYARSLDDGTDLASAVRPVRGDEPGVLRLH